MNYIRGYMTFPLSVKEIISKKAVKLSGKNVDVLFFDKYVRRGEFFDNGFFGIFINGKIKTNSSGIMNFFYRTTNPQRYKVFNFKGLTYDVSDCGECLPLKLESAPKYYVAKRFWCKNSSEANLFKKKAALCCDFKDTSFRLAEPRKTQEEGQGVFVLESFNLRKLEKILKGFPKDRYIGFEDVHILPMMKSIN